MLLFHSKITSKDLIKMKNISVATGCFFSRNSVSSVFVSSQWKMLRKAKTCEIHFRDASVHCIFNYWDSIILPDTWVKQEYINLKKQSLRKVFQNSSVSFQISIEFTLKRFLSVSWKLVENVLTRPLFVQWYILNARLKGASKTYWKRLKDVLETC